mgnify:CR=1 FL=1
MSASNWAIVNPVEPKHRSGVVRLRSLSGFLGYPQRAKRGALDFWVSRCFQGDAFHHPWSEAHEQPQLAIFIGGECGALVDLVLLVLEQGHDMGPYDAKILSIQENTAQHGPFLLKCGGCGRLLLCGDMHPSLPMPY